MALFDQIFGKNKDNKNEGSNESKNGIWNILNSEEQWKGILANTDLKSFAVFKHSTRCSISSMAKSRLERSWDIADEQLDLYYLDLIAFRSISNLIATDLDIQHQSPQLIVVENGKVVYHDSHNSISVEEIKANLAS